MFAVAIWDERRGNLFAILCATAFATCFAFLAAEALMFLMFSALLSAPFENSG